MQTKSHVKHYSPRQASKYLADEFGLSYAPATLNRLRSVGGGPGFRRVGRTIMYPETELNQWAEAKFGDVLTSTSQAPKAA